MKELYYNPVRYPASIKFINKAGKTQTVSKERDPNDLLFIGDLYNVSGLYQDIIVELTSDNEAYYPEPTESNDGSNAYVRIAVEGEVSLKDYINGGGYFDDPRLYPNDNRLKDGVLAWRL